ncbi:MAG: hypothetical protein KA120_01375 [Candidatus Goldbacteria bacterium]|nr:hypothetical protein [Candidatus Goldiibacteriota bacterium]
MKKSFSPFLRTVVCVVLSFMMLGCGTILYPNRIGQKGGNLDPAVCIMDGLACLLFLIPGIIAFAVDFSNGTIYLPHGKGSSLDLKNARVVKFDKNTATFDDIEKIVKRETGYDVSISDSNVGVYAFNSFDEMSSQYTLFMPQPGNVVCSK